MFPSLPVLSKHLASTPFKRAQTGLFHGSLIQFGNNVPFSKHKTRRTWLPNVQRKGLRSDLLGKEVQVKLTARALRTIKKYGGLDPYILNTRHDVLGPEGMRIRLLLREKQEEFSRQPSASSSSRDPKSFASASPTLAGVNTETTGSSADFDALLGVGLEKSSEAAQTQTSL